MKKYKYLYGPVPSRRLQRSLGVELTPYKTCDYDCVFCQLGRTSKKTVKRAEYVPLEEIFSELERWLRQDGEADFITLSGSGEPTLHSGFGRVLEFIKEAPIPSALLTNGSMMFLPEVRKAAALADVVKISLSAWDQRSFVMINRPEGSLSFDEVLRGQKKLRRQLQGELLVEVFVLLGMNSKPSDMEKIAAHIRKIEPDRVQLNTVVRPPAEKFARPAPKEILEELSSLFDPPAEIIATFTAHEPPKKKIDEETIFCMLRRRPCTMEQISQAFNLHITEASKYMGCLMRSGRIFETRKNAEVFYGAKEK